MGGGAITEHLVQSISRELIQKFLPSMTQQGIWILKLPIFNSVMLSLRLRPEILFHCQGTVLMHVK